MLKMVICCAVMAAALPAQSQQRQHSTTSGKPVAVWGSLVCNAVSDISGRAANGTISFVDAKEEYCAKGKIDVMRRVVYTPNPGFKGTDTVYIYLWGDLRAEVKVHVR